MSWPGTDFEVEIQNELDELRARNAKLEAFIDGLQNHMHPEGGGCECCEELWFRFEKLEEDT